MEKDFLQSLKLEISKTFKLVPYERIAFHKVLGIFKSENGMKILLRDIRNSSSLVRKSAISVIKQFNYPEVTKGLIEQLNEKISETEIFAIFEHLESFGTNEHTSFLIEYINKYADKTDYLQYLLRAVSVLGIIGKDSEEVINYLREIALNTETFDKLRCAAIESLNIINDIKYYQLLLKEEHDNISCSTYKTIARVIKTKKATEKKQRTDEIFSKTPDQEDQYILEIRVLLGKMTARFDSYSNETKSAFIMAMLITEHREFIIYTMKAITSDNADLIDKTLFVIMANVHNLSSVDKLFRSLIALPSVTKRDNGIIIEIFIRYFSEVKDRRSEVLIRDKIYNYIVVMLDSYFETYRKDFMIPEIMEKGYPKEFQLIRRFILRRFNPELKLQIIRYFASDEEKRLKNLLLEISEKVPYASEDDKEALQHFIEILWEDDKKIREISSSRIHDINFEKRYLRNKIVRLCQIIGKLHIEEASANLVKIFNYVKKYYDQDIYNSVTYTLSLLNYPYMLGELEVLLFSGDEQEKKWAVKLLSLFSEQRSLNIMLDYLREHHEKDVELVKSLLGIVIKRDVTNNVAANEIAKIIIKENKNSEVKMYAILLVGKGGSESDIEYLNDLFSTLSSSIEKEAVVNSMSIIVGLSDTYNAKIVINYLQEYLKDSGIKVRMLASATLLKMGNKAVLHSIREMMIIKNQQIQREVLMIIGSYMSLELAYFLVSLLRDEYAISQDIIPLIKLLPEEDIKEVDHFIVNLFKKFEGANFDYEYGVKKTVNSEEEKIKYFSKDQVIVFKIEIINYLKIIEATQQAIINLDFQKYYKEILEEINKNNGIISNSTGGIITAYFQQSQLAGTVGLNVLKLTSKYNYALKEEEQVSLLVYVDMLEKEMINNEIIINLQTELNMLKKAPLENRIIISGNLSESLNRLFKCVPFTNAIFSYRGYEFIFKELETPLNFLVLAEEIVNNIERDYARKEEIKKQIEEGVRSQVVERRSPSSIAYAKAMEDIGKILKKELADIHKYVSSRSTDRELIRNVEKMLTHANKRYLHETSKIIID